MLILSCLFLSIGFIVAQTKSISGTVIDGTGEPVIGASVVVKGTTIGVSTDVEGKFTINMPTDKNTLVFSLIGMTAVERTATNGMQVVMNEDAKDLDEIIITAYGTSSKKNVISSISKVSSDDLGRLTVASVDMALQGAAPGIMVSANSGAPGNGNTVRLRGVTSISGSNSPLYVVDGVPIFTGNTVSDIYGGQGSNALTNLSTTDIESVEVLKDASATSIYGARASNGVILITTKRGKSGKAKVEFNVAYGFQKPIEFYETMNLGEYLKFADTAYENTYGSGYSSYRSWALGYASDINLPANSTEMQNIYAKKTKSYADYIKNNNAPIKETNIGVSGGTDKTQYYLGGSYFDQEGTVKGQNYKRSSIRLNLDQEAFSWLKLSAGLTISDEAVNRTNGDNNIYAPTTTSVLELPGYEIYNPNGSFNLDGFSFTNPLQAAMGVLREQKTQRYLGNIGFRATPFEGLTINGKASTDRLYVKERTYESSETVQSWGKGTAFYSQTDLNRTLYTLTANYSKDFLEKLNVNTLVGYEYQRSKTIYSDIEKTGFPSTSLTWPQSGATPTIADAYLTENILASYFGRISGSYDDKYLAEFSLRADASSKFGKNNRVGYFPAVSIGWKMHNESWFNIEKINELKIKAGYGITGNETGIGNYSSRTLAELASYGNYPGIAVTQLGDPDLSWEKTAQLSAGFDLGLFNDRLTFSYEYFNKKTTDLLLSSPLPYSTGFRSVMKNVGEMENYGHEISINGKIIDNSTLKWDATFSISTLKNEVTKLYAGSDGKYTPIDYGFITRVDVNQSLGSYYVYKSLGLDSNGDVIYDTGEDGKLGDEDRYYAGKPLPDYTGAFSTSLEYKGFDLSVLFQFSQGYEIYNMSKTYAGSSSSIGFNKFRDQLNYWTPTNTNTNLPRPTVGAQQGHNNLDSDRFVEDGSYVRFKNLTFGYTLPKNITKMFKVRMYFSADNLVTWTDYTGLDPEVSALGNKSVELGNDFFTQGLNRTYKFGINVSF